MFIYYIYYVLPFFPKISTNYSNIGNDNLIFSM